MILKNVGQLTRQLVNEIICKTCGRKEISENDELWCKHHRIIVFFIFTYRGKNPLEWFSASMLHKV